jgi:ribosomal protein L11 methyltransferase
MSWLELRFDSRHPEFAEEALFALGAQAVRLEDAADDPVLEPAPGTTPLWPTTASCGLFTPDFDLAAVETQLRELLPDGVDLVFRRRHIEDADWLEAWKAHAEPLFFAGNRLCICPSHRLAATTAPALVTLDPGLAFGTGSHPSTALCLEWLAQTPPVAKRILDYGCGSGILAIAALKLGASSAVGVDIDPQAIIASRLNAAFNAVQAEFDCAESLADSAGDFDVVVANILASPLIALAPLLCGRLRLGGRIALAGLLDRQAEEVRAAYAPWIEFEPDGQLDGWTRLAGHRQRR